MIGLFKNNETLGTGKQSSVREMVEIIFALANIHIKWQGEGEKEEGYDERTKKVYVKVDPQFFRPLEVENLLANPEKSKSNKYYS